MANFKHGDKVRIKEGVSSATHMAIPPGFVKKMDDLKGKTFEVYGADSRGHIIVQGIPHLFAADWLEPACDAKKSSSVWQETLEAIEGLVDAIDELLTSETDGAVEGESILEEAMAILDGDRESDYGDPVANFNRIADIASSISRTKISPEQCVVVMMAVKLSREQYKHKRDNLVDLVAYAEILNRIREQK
mgnify:CR=1 FL=1